MEINGKRFLVIGGAGLIGSHTVDALLKEKVEEIIVFVIIYIIPLRIFNWVF